LTDARLSDPYPARRAPPGLPLWAGKALHARHLPYDRLVSAYETSNFIADAESAFAWLNLDGYRRTAADGESNSWAHVAFADSRLYVRVGWDVRDNLVQLTFGPLIGGQVPEPWPDAFQGHVIGYPLWLLVWVATGDEATARSIGKDAGSAESIRGALNHMAALLKEHGSAILAGDLSLLPVLDRANAQRIAANIDHKPWGQPPRS
jgi:hypothetical protein